jgi:hypothetical protein
MNADNADEKERSAFFGVYQRPVSYKKRDFSKTVQVVSQIRPIPLSML